MSMRGIGFKYENLAKNFLLNKKMKYSDPKKQSNQITCKILILIIIIYFIL